ncbi:hypothetical protein A6X21_02255 [Planctopirus hydrillae]|uniref:Uncharacterized protein n=1 Tax=Planctopirus hydrillae TaxID=1841610 RepID=A0A1C3ET82_9PLAN|nr:hypothetical protein A6X21_02255 [Planctopirus hydrillae]
MVRILANQIVLEETTGVACSRFFVGGWPFTMELVRFPGNSSDVLAEKTCLPRAASMARYTINRARQGPKRRTVTNLPNVRQKFLA